MDNIEKSMEMFMHDFSVVGDAFQSFLEYSSKVLEWCVEKHLILNWEKCDFMVK